MSRIPRLLPLVGVAIGGVLAIKALADVDALPRAMAGARAFAEDALPRSKGAKAKPDTAAAAATLAPPTAKPLPAGVSPTSMAAGAAAAAPKVCAPSATDLAREAGLSPAELQVLQSLTTRRTQLDSREQDLDTQIQLLAAAEAKLDAKLKALNGLKGDLQALLGQTEQKESAEIDRLVIVYSKMKPRDAAAVMTQLEDHVRIPVAGKMKEAALAAVLSQMPPLDAKKLTESLAHRYDKVQQLAQSATTPAAPGAAPATAAPPAGAAPTKPAAAAAKPAATAAADATATPDAKPAVKPAALRKRRPAAKPKQVAQASPSAAATAALSAAAAAPPSAPAPAAPAPAKPSA